MEHFTTYYRKLTRSEPIQCTNSGETYSGILKPDAIITDPFGLPILKVVYAITCNTIPVLSWIAVSAASTLRLYGPEGGRCWCQSTSGIRPTDWEKAEDPGDEMYRPSEGKLVPVPGLPLSNNWSAAKLECSEQKAHLQQRVYLC